jgi:Fe-S-cluster containining protein
MASGLSFLRFRCTECGNCCRDLRVPLTHADLRRLVVASGAPPARSVDWLEPDAVDMTGEPESFVLLDQPGRRVLMTLVQRENACAFLGADERCTVYEARPASCRLYPFAISFGQRGGVRRLRLLGGTDCAYTRDGHNDAHALRIADEQRWAEHRAYVQHVADWNRLQRHRERLGQALRGAAEFFEFLGLSSGARREAPRLQALPTAALELPADVGANVVNGAVMREPGAP